MLIELYYRQNTLTSNNIIIIKQSLSYEESLSLSQVVKYIKNQIQAMR